jgi:two-component system chemotaxis sensor kinase CheA
MDDLLAEFLAETREMLEAVGGELVAWEADPTDRARLDAIFRFVHTVKGNCGFFDFPRLEALSHAAEDALAEVRAERRSIGPRLVTAVLGIVDRIGEMIDAIEAGEELPERGDDVLIAALQADADDDAGEVAAHPADTASAKGGSGGAQRSIRLPVGLLDSVMSSVSDLVLARNDLARRLREAGADPAIDGPFERLSAILDGVRESVTRMRMHRIEHLFGALPRLVRDLSAELGKQVMIDLEGGDVELDREMIEMIRDPLTHIIRNAIDHGIESPQERLAAGKREIGTLHISARQTGNRIMLAITDDGRGIDGDKLVAKAIAAGALTREEAAGLSPDERHALVFEPGLSTAENVTSVSGRGVGMDVVRANIERVGGSIEVTSTPGQGARILMRLPLTLSIIPALTVGAGGQLFAIPRSYVEEIVHGGSSSAQFATMGDALLVTVRGRRIPCLSLAGVLGMEQALPPEKSPLVLIRLAGGDLFALAADRIHDHEELVIKPLAPALMAVGIYAGTTLLDDGSPVLMLDIAGIARGARLTNDLQKRSARSDDAVIDPAGERAAVPVVLFAGLDGRRRAIRMDAINRIEKVSASAADLDGERPQVVIADTIFALAGTGRGALPADHLSVLRLSDGESEIAYAIERIIDTAVMHGEIVGADAPGEIEGTTLIGGVPAEVVDTFWLFARHARPPRAATPLVCRISDGDEWARTILGPLIEAAGYRVVGEDWPGQADIAIAGSDGEEETIRAGQVIKLNSDPDSADGRDGGIYRYDRAGLVAALTAARTRKAG